MSDLQDVIVDSSIKSFNMGVKHGVDQENARLVKRLEGYFELTQERNESGDLFENREWDNGFQAALALIKTEQK